MSGQEHWMTRQLRQVKEEAKTWPAWRHEEAKRRFGSDSSELERRAASPGQETSYSAPPDTSQQGESQSS